MPFSSQESDEGGEEDDDVDDDDDENDDEDGDENDDDEDEDGDDDDGIEITKYLAMMIRMMTVILQSFEARLLSFHLSVANSPQQ